jgi:hypothetical protein
MFKILKELLVEAQVEVLNVFRKLSSQPDFAPVLASQIISRVLEVYVKK